MTPQLALRVAIVGSVALALFAIIFFRLWFLQVLSGEQYVRAATVNRVRNVAVPAQRGEILDRSGNVLVDSRQALAVQITPDRPADLAGRPARPVPAAGRGAGLLAARHPLPDPDRLGPGRRSLRGDLPDRASGPDPV